MSSEHNFFHLKKTINCAGKLLDLSVPVVMGIINITPDSFYAESRSMEKDVLSRAEKMLHEGASILDFGGQSTRPGAKMTGEEEEQQRVIPAIKAVKKAFSEAVISVDTFYSSVAKKAVEEGAGMVNDISGGTMDEKMFETVADLQVPYILMHMKGHPGNMQADPSYEDVTEEVFKYLLDKSKTLKAMGVKDIIVDPGFGFGKTLEHNYVLLKKLAYFKLLNLPVMAGISRKSMICKLLKKNPDDALNGTTVAHVPALMNGADILRVHDVQQAKEAIKIVQYYQKC